LRILIDNGAPMDSSVIRQILQENRGLGKHFQINPSRYIARVSRGRWGLVERDFGLSREEYSRLVDAAFSQIAFVGELVETDQLFAFLRSQNVVPSSLTPFAVANLLQTDDRLHIFRGDMAGLAEWASSEEIINDALSESSEISVSGPESLLLDFDPA
jgi:hypothetical protein